jgi:CPA1 family monovalent cation:H+ antiporter
MRAIDDYAVEISISIALAAVVYAAGQALHVSGAIAAVAAGLIVGDHGVRTAMSDTTRRYLQGFWALIDEILNALLFLLLGLELLVLPFDLRYGGVWLAIVPLVLAARFVTVLPWGAYFHFRHEERGPSLLLTWGGLRGALSLALALSVPQGPARPVILSLTYVVVVFAVVIQGLSFGPLAKALGDLRKPSSGRLDD